MGYNDHQGYPRSCSLFIKSIICGLASKKRYLAQGGLTRSWVNIILYTIVRYIWSKFSQSVMIHEPYCTASKDRPGLEWHRIVRSSTQCWIARKSNENFDFLLWQRVDSKIKRHSLWHTILTRELARNFSYSYISDQDSGVWEAGMAKHQMQLS